MPPGQESNRTPRDKTASSAGVRRHPGLTLSDVNKRRAELWAVSLFVVTAVTIAIALIAVGSDILQEFIALDDLFTWIVMILVAGLALAFLLYVFDKERNLRGLTNLLVEERVLSAALSNRLSEISRLSEVGKAINTTLDLQDVFHLILSSALELLGGSEGSIMLLTEDGKELEVVSYQGPAFETVMRGRVTLGEGIAGTVADRISPMLVQGNELPGRLKDAGHPERNINSAMCVPLIRRGELLGVLNLNETDGKRTFTEHDLSALGFFAEHAAIAIGNASLFEQERETVTRLEELDRLKSDFVATVSHELKTPLTAIIGAAKTVARRGGAMDSEQHAGFMDMIQRQGNRLLRLVDDVLTAARIESGLPRMRRELLDLKVIAENVIEELRHLKRGENRSILLTTEPEKPQVWGDSTAVQQILVNLIENALKYSEIDREVRVTVKELPTEAILEVSDRGSGISDEQLEHIFERFRQVDSSSTRPVGGFGLGLYIVKNLVDAHSGRIDVESKLGEGSTFRVHLPKRSQDRSE